MAEIATLPGILGTTAPRARLSVFFINGISHPDIDPSLEKRGKEILNIVKEALNLHESEILYSLIHSDDGLFSSDPKTASELTDKVIASAFPVVVFAHSKGTDIVDQAFRRFNISFRNPTLIIGLGPVRSLSDSNNVRSVSIISHDPTAYVGAGLMRIWEFLSGSYSPAGSDKGEEISIGGCFHTLEDYLASPFVIDTISTRLKKLIIPAPPFRSFSS